MYLTPERFKTMGFGVEIPEDDFELRNILRRASVSVDRYCNAPLSPSRYSFLGGTVVDEQHDFDLGNGVSRAAQRQIFLDSTPIKSVTSLRVYVTNQQYIDFTNELFVKRNSVEIISLAMTANGLFGAALIPAIGLTKPLIRATYDYGYEYTATDEVIEAVDGRTFQAQNQFWTDAAVTVKVDGVVQVGGYTLDRTEGEVIFDAMQDPDAVVTVSYTYPLPSDIAEATGLIAAQAIARKDVYEKGMGLLASIKVGEISMERNPMRVVSQQGRLDIPPEAATLLDSFVFLTVR